MRRVHPLVRKIRSASRRLGVVESGVLLAVSGGGDSLAMLLAFAELRKELGLRVEVATVDHGLRPESADEARFVEQVCAQRGIPFHLATVAIDRVSAIESTARTKRYEALRRIAREQALQLIATGHTLEDQVETVLFRLARGAGLRGARGILERRGAVVRPMLDVRRAEVADYLASEGVAPRVDGSNASPEFARNRIRALVLPALEEALGSSSLKAIARFAALARDDERLLASRARTTADRLFERTGEAAWCRQDALARVSVSLRRRVLGREARRLGVRLTSSQLLAMDRALASPRPLSIDLQGGLQFRVRYGELRLEPAAERPPPRVTHEIRIDGPGRFAAGKGNALLPPGAWLEVRKVAGPGAAAKDAIRVAPAGVALPLVVRSRQPGDRFRPRGGGSVKLKEFLIDRKIPREQRDFLPLLCDAAGEILWVVGVRQGQATEAGERAQEAWEVSLRCEPMRPESLAVSRHEPAVAAGAGSAQGIPKGRAKRNPQ